MFKQLFIFIFVLGVGFMTMMPQVQAQSNELSEALKRMDVIIAEMQSLRSEFAKLATTLGSTAPVPVVLGVTTGGILGDDLLFGSTNDDIKKIQTLLATDSTIYPYGVASGYFGPKTQEAIRMFQSRFGLDTVGVVGPSTKALLELFLGAYPNGEYPDDVLQKGKPETKTVATASVSKPTVISTAVSAKTLKSISISEEDDEHIVRSYGLDGKRNRDLILYPEDGDDLVEMIAKKLGASEAEVRMLLDSDDLDFGKKKSSRKNADEDDANDAIDDANKAIKKARDTIRDADDDGDDIRDADELYDEARDLWKDAREAVQDEEYNDAVELAEESEKLAENAIDELDGSSSGSGDVTSIEVRVKDGEARVDVEFKKGKDDSFTVEDDDVEDIIDEIADALDLSVSDVKDVIDVEYGDIDKIVTSVGGTDGKIRVRVYFESGADSKFTFAKNTDEDDIIEEIADALYLRKSEVEDEIDFE